MVVTRSLVVGSDLTWRAHVLSRNITSKAEMSAIPATVDSNSFAKLLKIVDTVRVCPGNLDVKFEPMIKGKKGKLSGVDGRMLAYEDAGCSVMLNGESFSRTIRTTNCDILVHEGKCSSCHDFRRALRTMYSWWLKRPASLKTPKSCTNSHFLNTPQKIKRIEN